MAESQQEVNNYNLWRMCVDETARIRGEIAMLQSKVMDLDVIRKPVIEDGMRINKSRKKAASTKLSLKFLEMRESGMTTQEISKKCDLTVSTVRDRITEAKSIYR